MLSLGLLKGLIITSSIFMVFSLNPFVVTASLFILGGCVSFSLYLEKLYFLSINILVITAVLSFFFFTMRSSISVKNWKRLRENSFSKKAMVGIILANLIISALIFIVFKEGLPEGLGSLAIKENLIFDHILGQNKKSFFFLMAFSFSSLAICLLLDKKE